MDKQRAITCSQFFLEAHPKSGFLRAFWDGHG
jgi:hypothetical protein